MLHDGQSQLRPEVRRLVGGQRVGRGLPVVRQGGHGLPAPLAAQAGGVRRVDGLQVHGGGLPGAVPASALQVCTSP